jgi:hypothetical protein
MHLDYLPSVVPFTFASRLRNSFRFASSRAIRRLATIGFVVFFQCASVFGAQLTVAWDDNSSSEIGFKVERSTNGSTFTTVAIVGANKTNYTDSSVVSATKYWYRVKAYDLLRSSAYSNVTSATTPSATTTSPTGGTTTQTTGRIKALTARAITEFNDPQSLILKFSVSGSSKSILLRGVGPGLDPYTDAKVLPDPKLKLYSGSTLVASNDNWGGSTTLVSLFKQVGAYPIPWL